MLGVLPQSEPSLGDAMRRREFITLLSASAAAWPLAARAQQAEHIRRVGVLMGYDQTEPEAHTRLALFRQGLAERGWVEGRNLQIEVRWADLSSQPRLARELVAMAPEVLLAHTTTIARALRDATRTIPIVFVTLQDPVINGIVSNLARPEANLTGFTTNEYSMAGKWMSLLKDMVPQLARVAVLFNGQVAPYAPLYVQAAQNAAERLALKVTGVDIRDPTAIAPAIAAVAASGDGGLIIIPSIFLFTNRAETITLAAKHKVPAVYYSRDWVEGGGLMSYGTDMRHQFHDGATYVDRILRGAKPGDLPVQFATKFELLLNLKTAKTLGLNVPLTLQAAADELIE